MSEQNRKILKELESLALEADETSPAERLAKLEAKLRDCPEAQDEYCRLVMLDTILKAEFGPNALSLTPLSPELSETDACSMVAATLANDIEPTVPTLSKRLLLGITAATAASLIFVLSYFGTVPSADDTQNQNAAEVASMTTSDADIFLQSPETIGMLHRVTHTTWQPPRQTDQDSERRLTAQLIEGAVRMMPFNGKDAGGYVLKLPPGAVLELNTYADADGENALAIIELDSRGEPTGQLVSFGNRGAQISGKRSRIYGHLGSWSDVNETNADKFYLLTGLQHVIRPKEEPIWYVAGFKVFVNRSNLLHIGWDDTGSESHEMSTDLRDKDFNDLTATLRITFPNINSVPPANEVEIVDPEQPDVIAQEIAPELLSQDGFDLQVLPGEGVIMNVSSACFYGGSLTLVERDTGKVWRRWDNQDGELSHLGVLLIENNTLEPLDFHLVGNHRIGKSKQELASRHKLLWYDELWQIVGFDDSKADEDWNDLRVHLYWLRNRAM